MRKAIGQLESAGPVNVARLAQNPATGLAVERALALLEDLALAINRDVSAAVLGQIPQTCAAAFSSARKAGLIDARLASDLVPASGPHNVLVQLCLDREPEAIEAIVASALAGYREYVRQVANWTAPHSSTTREKGPPPVEWGPLGQTDLRRQARRAAG